MLEPAAAAAAARITETAVIVVVGYIVSIVNFGIYEI